MSKPIRLITDAETKVECYRLLTQIMTKEIELTKMKLKLSSMTNKIVQNAGDGYSLADDFDCIKKGVEQ